MGLLDELAAHIYDGAVHAEPRPMTQAEVNAWPGWLVNPSDAPFLNALRRPKPYDWQTEPEHNTHALCAFHGFTHPTWPHNSAHPWLCHQHTTHTYGPTEWHGAISPNPGEQ